MRHFRVHCELSNVLQMMMMIMILTNDQSAKPSSSTRRAMERGTCNKDSTTALSFYFSFVHPQHILNLPVHVEI